MSRKMVLVLAGYGVVWLGLGVALGTLSPEHGRTASLVAVAAGGLALVWVGAALAGMKGRGWALGTTVLATVTLLTQTVHLWTYAGQVPVPGTARMLVTVLFLGSMAMVLYLIHGERAPEYYQRGVFLNGDRADETLDRRGG
jgi:hypothetical protein